MSEENNVDWESAIGHLFCDAVDNNRDRLEEALDEDAVLIWFGRTVSGNTKIVQFLNMIAPCTQHYLYKSKRSEPYNRKRKPNENSVNEEQKESPTDEKRLSRKRPHPSNVNPVVNLIHILAGISSSSKENNNNDKGADNGVIKVTPALQCNLVDVQKILNQDDENTGNGTILRAIDLYSTLYLSAKNRLRKSGLWERKVKGIHVEFDKHIQLIIYAGDSSCRKNLSTVFENLKNDDSD